MALFFTFQDKINYVPTKQGLSGKRQMYLDAARIEPLITLMVFVNLKIIWGKTSQLDIKILKYHFLSLETAQGNKSCQKHD